MRTACSVYLLKRLLEWEIWLRWLVKCSSSLAKTPNTVLKTVRINLIMLRRRRTTQWFRGLNRSTKSSSQKTPTFKDSFLNMNRHLIKWRMAKQTLKTHKTCLTCRGQCSSSSNKSCNFNKTTTSCNSNWVIKTSLECPTTLRFISFNRRAASSSKKYKCLESVSKELKTWKTATTNSWVKEDNSSAKLNSWKIFKMKIICKYRTCKCRWLTETHNTKSLEAESPPSLSSSKRNQSNKDIALRSCVTLYMTRQNVSSTSMKMLLRIRKLFRQTTKPTEKYTNLSKRFKVSRKLLVCSKPSSCLKLCQWLIKKDTRMKLTILIFRSWNVSYKTSTLNSKDKERKSLRAVKLFKVTLNILVSSKPS